MFTYYLKYLFLHLKYIHSVNKKIGELAKNIPNTFLGILLHFKMVLISNFT